MIYFNILHFQRYQLKTIKDIFEFIIKYKNNQKGQRKSFKNKNTTIKKYNI